MQKIKTAYGVCFRGNCVLRTYCNAIALRKDVSKKGFLCRLNSGKGIWEQLETKFQTVNRQVITKLSFVF